ncbi:MAG: ATP-dependent DNA helicase RecQ [Cyclobacteriaceae bacterium]
MTDPKEILHNYWGFEHFRESQLEIIESVLKGQNTLALLPTGGGKSICFQIPGLLLEGVTLVVTPLIALMIDQVNELKKRNIKAVAIHGGLSSREIDILLDNCIYGGIKFLYLSPERLASELFLARLEKMVIALFVIDEAHCISQWGHDFRPYYLKIKDFTELFPMKKLIALTASATEEVKKDIIKQLDLADPKVFQNSYARANLSYVVFKGENKFQKVYDILNKVEGSSIVYVGSRKRAEQVSRDLSQKGISAQFYHAGLSFDERNQRQAAWIKSKLRVMVATNAFGMGINKPDVRTVLHLDLPQTLEAYYQEAGRAGRDGLKAYAVLLFHDQDIVETEQRISRAAVNIKFVKRVYQALSNRYKMAIGSGAGLSFDFVYIDFINDFDLPAYPTVFALKKLENAGLIQLTENVFQKSKISMLMQREVLYQFQVAHASLDPLIKVLFRLHGGELYTSYMMVNEADIAGVLKINLKKVKEQLHLLHDYQVIDYRMTTFKPQIEFIEGRLDLGSLPIQSVDLQKRNQQTENKFHRVLHYVNTNHICRTRMLQDYFGEQTDLGCGICDYCLSRKKVSVDLNPLEIIRSIPSQGIDLYALSTLFKLYDQEDLITVLRKLVDENKIYFESGAVIKKR